MLSFYRVKRSKGSIPGYRKPEECYDPSRRPAYRPLVLAPMPADLEPDWRRELEEGGPNPLEFVVRVQHPDVWRTLPPWHDPDRPRMMPAADGFSISLEGQP